MGEQEEINCDSLVKLEEKAKMLEIVGKSIDCRQSLIEVLRVLKPSGYVPS